MEDLCMLPCESCGGLQPHRLVQRTGFVPKRLCVTHTTRKLMLAEDDERRKYMHERNGTWHLSECLLVEHPEMHCTCNDYSPD